MAKLKMAISIEKPLFDEVEALSEKLKISLSYLFTQAAREFIQHHKSQKLMEAISAANRDSPAISEEKLRAQRKSKQRRLVKDQR